MRIRQLNLLRYGKFTDQVLLFPHSSRDFHLIVGANEAGKSTTRSAILDLLYGIEARSTYDFVHAKPEMRLGATIEHGGACLEFVRAKANKKTLLDAAGNALPDSALATFLSGTDRAFFDQMFGLDHARLEAGGNAILSASTDIGQILFQSAAGIASLGGVRETLAAEADQLWAPRRSGERAYYIASDDLARADAALKAATVRTKDWLEARGKVQDLEQRRELTRGRYRDFEAQRIRLERVRRVASAVRTLRARQAELQQLGDVVLLPHEAGKQLSDTELELAGAEGDQQHYTVEAQQVREQLANIQPDERLLNHAVDIGALAERRQQVRNHERDVGLRQAEIAVHWQRVETLVRQLGWPPTNEAALSENLPALPARAAVAGAIKRFGVIDQARQVAIDALTEKAAEKDSLDAQLEGLLIATVPPALRAALTTARALGDLKGSIARDEALVAKRMRELTSAVAGLGRWSLDLVALRGLVLPSEADVGQRMMRHTDAQMSRKLLTDKHTELSAGINAQELEIAQYRNAHHPVSWEELAEVRAERDAVWRSIKSGDRPAHELAARFEVKLTFADSLSDQRHDKAREVSELQSKLDALERLQHQVAENAARLAANDAALESLDVDWAQLTAEIGLVGLPLQEFQSWRAAREKALAADDALVDVQQTLHKTQETTNVAAIALRAALSSASITVDSADPLGMLILIASDAVDGATEAKARQDELNKQRDAAANTLVRQTEKAAAAQAQFDTWSTQWRSATAQLGLSESIDVAVAEGALTLITEMDTKLAEIREIRKARIEAMQQDLRDFAQEVAVVVSAAAPDLIEENPSTAIPELTVRLAKALDEQKDIERLRKDLEKHESQATLAGARVDRARATMQPLLHLAKVVSHDALRELIARSDRRRLVEVEASAALKVVEEGGDGLPLEALEAEITTTDPAQVPVLMADVVLEIEAVQQEQDALTAELTTATSELDRIAGQAAAARAESDRQDALAKMANAAERYIKVYTASRLLKWAIDRYRETKQGPMLSRASEIFSALTLGSFQKLTVDFDSEPLSLHGLRPDGGRVGIAGMSDGARDQLYLALRLAALELHLGQGHALPFIADDLFINYDDMRAKAGLEALAKLAERTQVIFLSHHMHLVPTVQAVFGGDVNVVAL